MSGRPTNLGVEGMDFDETQLKERFEAAVGDIQPDVVSLAVAGTAGGRAMVRRRAQLLGVAAAAAVIALGATYASTSTDLFGTRPAQPTGPHTVSQLEPATPRGLAAAVMSHTDRLGELLAVGGSSLEADSGSVQSGVFADVAYTLPDGTKLDLQVYASPDLTAWESTCADFNPTDTCRELTLSDGTPAAYFELDPGTNLDPHETDGVPVAANGFVVKRSDQIVTVIQMVVGSSDLPLDDADLQVLLEDPAIGLSTTAAFNASGQDLADFGTGLGREESGSGSGSATASASTAEPPASPKPNGAHRRSDAETPGTSDSSSAMDGP